MSFEFVIEDGVSIPKREIEFAPRGSQYPLEHMKKGQSFCLNVVGSENAAKKDGTPLTVEEDAKRKAAQKQSYFSSLGKKLGVNVVTRYFPNGEPDADGTESGNPELRVWHDGERTAKQKAKDAKDAKDAKASAADTTEEDPDFVDLGDE
jgi:hypothetical protein